MQTHPPFVYLASQSPRRRELLRQLGVEFEVLLPPDTVAAEALEALHPREAAGAYVRRVTGLKLEAALTRLAPQDDDGAPVLCADTTVALDRQILGKPADEADAARMLHALSGRTHRVLTAVAVGVGAWRGRALSVSHVRFAVLRTADVAAYVASGEWRGKAGGYAIQGRAAAFIAHLSGSYSGVMGLPLFETAGLLRAAQARRQAQ
jgi:septum formation protein